MSAKSTRKRLERAHRDYVDNLKRAIHKRQYPKGPFVTQGSRRNDPRFDDCPRAHEIDVSVHDGRVTVEVLTRNAFRRSPFPGDRVRFLALEALAGAEYQALATPSKGNAFHASIIPHLSIPTAEHEQWWNAPDRVTLTEIAVVEEEVK